MSAKIIWVKLKDNLGREHVFLKKEDLINYLEEGKKTAEDGYPVKKMLDNLINEMHAIAGHEKGRIHLGN